MSRCTEALVAGLLVASAGTADAHETASSRFEARPAVSAAGVGLQVVFRLDATSIFDMTGATGGEAVLAYLDRGFAVTAGGAPCPREAPRELGHDPAAKVVVIDVVYRCGGRVTIESTLFHDELIPHTVIGTIRLGGRADRHFFTRGERAVTVEVAAPSRGAFRTATPPPGAFAAPAADPDPAPADRSLLHAALAFLAVLGAAGAASRLRERGARAGRAGRSRSSCRRGRPARRTPPPDRLPGRTGAGR